MEGAGLGLAIAARIVGLMGGAIGHVPNPGGGSVFWLELPTARRRRGCLGVERGAGRRPAPAGMRVLLVDDIAMNRDVIGAFLRRGRPRGDSWPKAGRRRCGSRPSRPST